MVEITAKFWLRANEKQSKQRWWLLQEKTLLKLNQITFQLILKTILKDLITANSQILLVELVTSFESSYRGNLH